MIGKKNARQGQQEQKEIGIEKIIWHVKREKPKSKIDVNVPILESSPFLRVASGIFVRCVH